MDIGGQPVITGKLQFPHRQQAVDPGVIRIELGLECRCGDYPIGGEIVAGEELRLRSVTARYLVAVGGSEVAALGTILACHLPQYAAAGRGDGLYRHRLAEALLRKRLGDRPRPFERYTRSRRHELRLLRAEQHHGDMGEAGETPHQ